MNLKQLKKRKSFQQRRFDRILEKPKKKLWQVLDKFRRKINWDSIEGFNEFGKLQVEVLKFSYINTGQKQNVKILIISDELFTKLESFRQESRRLVYPTLLDLLLGFRYSIPFDNLHYIDWSYFGQSKEFDVELVIRPGRLKFVSAETKDFFTEVEFVMTADIQPDIIKKISF